MTSIIPTDDDKSSVAWSRFALEGRLSAWPSLESARRRSLETLDSLKREWARALGNEEGVLVAACGSLGRLEAGPISDADLLIVLERDDPSRAQAALDVVFDSLDQRTIARPNSGGIYCRPTTLDQLLAAAPFTRLDDDRTTFAQRLQLLTEARPIIGGKLFANAIDRILSAYRRPRPSDSAWLILERDLARYLEAMAQEADHHLDARHDARLRRLKVKHGRRLAIESLRLLCRRDFSLVADIAGPPATFSVQTISNAEVFSLTPLERLSAIAPPALFEQAIGLYAEVHRSLVDREFRKRLERARPRSPSEATQPLPTFDRVDSVADQFGAILRSIEQAIERRASGDGAPITR